MDNFFGHIPTAQNSASASLSTGVQTVSPNAQALNIPRVVIEAFQASAKQGVPVRGEVVRENKDGSLRVRTREGTIDIQPQPRENNAQKSGNHSSPAAQQAQQQQVNTSTYQGQSAVSFRAGDAIRLDFPVDAFSSAKKANLLLQITADNVARQGTTLPPNTTRISQTPLQIQLSAQPQSGTQNTPIAARLEAVLPQNLQQVLHTSQFTNIINSTAQVTQITGNIIFESSRFNFSGAPLTTQNGNQTITQSVLLASSLFNQQNQSASLLPVTARSSQQNGLLSTALSTRHDALPTPQQGQTPSPVTAQNTQPSNPVLSSRFNILPQNFTLESAQITQPQNVQPSTPTLPQAISSPITHNQAAGHNIATVVGFTQNGSPVISLQTPQGGTVTAPPPQNSQQMPAIPLGQANSTAQLQSWGSANQMNFYILRAPDLAVQNLTIGSQLELSPQVSGQATTQGGIPVSTLSGNPFSILPPGLWPSLSEVQQALQGVAPALSQAMSNMTPNIASATSPAKMMPAALFFVAAMRSGDIQGWLGDKATDALRRLGKGDLLTRLGAEGQAINRVNAEPLSNDWRALNLPFLYEGEMQKVALYYKHDAQQDEDGIHEKRTRFVFDLSLPRMGNVQIDGLFRAKQLDLVVRATESFSPDMRQQMRIAYTSAMEASGLSGALSFQNDPRSFVTPKPQIDEFETHL